MELYTGVQSNCSEATIRIRIDNQDKDKAEELFNIIEKAVDGDTSSNISEWDDEDPVEELSFYDTYVSIDHIFGIDCIKVSGDGPYNKGSELTDLAEKYLDNPEIEWEE